MKCISLIIIRLNLCVDLLDLKGKKTKENKSITKSVLSLKKDIAERLDKHII